MQSLDTLIKCPCPTKWVSRHRLDWKVFQNDFINTMLFKILLVVVQLFYSFVDALVICWRDQGQFQVEETSEHSFSDDLLQCWWKIIF